MNRAAAGGGPPINPNEHLAYVMAEVMAIRDVLRQLEPPRRPSVD